MEEVEAKEVAILISDSIEAGSSPNFRSRAELSTFRSSPSSDDEISRKSRRPTSNNVESTSNNVELVEKSRNSVAWSSGYEEDKGPPEIYDERVMEEEEKSSKKLRISAKIEFMLLVSLVACLVASLNEQKMITFVIWDLESWRWYVIIMAIFCGRLLAEIMVNVVVFFLIGRKMEKKKNFLIRRNMYGALKRSVTLSVWSVLALVVWLVLIHIGAKRSKESMWIFAYITRALVSLLIGAALWLVKTILVKKLAFSFQKAGFFNRMRESLFDQYILETLSVPPMFEVALLRWTSSGIKKTPQEKWSFWPLEALTGSWLSTVSNELEQLVDQYNRKQFKKITKDWDANASAYHILWNVAKPGCSYIDEEDLSRFLIREEIDMLFPRLEGAETGRITKYSITKWVLRAYDEQKSLKNALNYTKITNGELNKLVSGVVFIVLIITWLLVMKLLTTEVVALFISQFLLLGFMFGNTAKTIFESAIFVFVVQPFSIGDRCVINGVQMVVEEISLLRTVFLKADKEKVFYPNSTLVTLPVSNFNTTANANDSLELAVDVSTTTEQIDAIKVRLRSYLLSKPEEWLSTHKVIVKGIEDEKKMKIGLFVAHNYFNFPNPVDRSERRSVDKSDRRSELILELKKILQDLGIKCHSIYLNT